MLRRARHCISSAGIGTYVYIHYYRHWYVPKYIHTHTHTHTHTYIHTYIHTYTKHAWGRKKRQSSTRCWRATQYTYVCIHPCIHTYTHTHTHTHIHTYIHTYMHTYTKHAWGRRKRQSSTRCWRATRCPRIYPTQWITFILSTASRTAVPEFILYILVKSKVKLFSGLHFFFRLPPALRYQYIPEFILYILTFT